MSENGVVGKCLVVLCWLIVVEQNYNLHVSGLQTNIECIPLQNCPTAMKMVSTKKYAPETINFLRTSHCGSSKKFGPLVWCPNFKFNTCITPDGQNGTCIDFVRCQTLLDKLASTTHLSKYRCNENLENSFHVCCANPEPKKMLNRFNDDPQDFQDLSRTEDMQGDQPIDTYPPKKYYPKNNPRKDSDKSWFAGDNSPASFSQFCRHFHNHGSQENLHPGRVWPNSESSTTTNYDRDARWPKTARAIKKTTTSSYTDIVWPDSDSWRSTVPSTTPRIRYDTTSKPAGRANTPSSTSRSTSTITNIYDVVAFKNLTPICGRQTANSDKIIGGSVVDIGDYPWMALLEYSSHEGRRFGCGGTLINKRYVLTAAHCVDQRVLRSRRMQLNRVLLGEYDTRNTTDCIYSPLGTKCADPVKYFGIESILIHERFDNVNGVEDIALIRLDSDVTFTDYIKPICLPTGDFSIKVNESLTVAGWGRTSSAERSSPVLMKARLPRAAHSACDRYGEGVATPALRDGQLCAGAGNGVDTCTGDSGGPMMVERARNFEMVTYQVAIVSYGYAVGEKCGNAPSVNTFVPYYIDWIRRNVV